MASLGLIMAEVNLHPHTFGLQELLLFAVVFARHSETIPARAHWAISYG
jgi:hypothetical protein